MGSPDIKICNFNSFYEIFAVLNLAYAGSEMFRAAIDDEMLKLSKALSPKIRNDIKTISSLIIVVGIDKNLSTEIQYRLNDIEKKFMHKKRELYIKSRFSERFVKGFKSVFLMSSFYCFTMIIIGGYETNFKNIYTPDFVLYFMHLVFLFNIILFIKSFLKPYYQKRIKPFYVFLLLATVALSSYLFCNRTYNYTEGDLLFKSEYNILISLVIAISAYLLHFLRVFLHKKYFRRAYNDLYSATRRELNEISIV